MMVYLVTITKFSGCPWADFSSDFTGIDSKIQNIWRILDVTRRGLSRAAKKEEKEEEWVLTCSERMKDKRENSRPQSHTSPSHSLLLLKSYPLTHLYSPCYWPPPLCLHHFSCSCRQTSQYFCTHTKKHIFKTEKNVHVIFITIWLCDR